MSAKTFGLGLVVLGLVGSACSSGDAFQAMPAEDGGSGTPESGADVPPRGDALADGDKGRTTCTIDAPIVHGVRADGRVDVSVSESWPNRAAEPPAVTPAELLGGCAIVAACFRLTGADGGMGAVDNQMADAIRSCVTPSSHGNEERVIPELNQNERWSFNLRTLLSKKGCAGLFNGTPRAPGILCQEDGCHWDPAMASPSVSCAGDVATLSVGSMSFTRDCSRSYTKCTDTSLTGCTDRPLVTCQSAGQDRCDGDVKLGCDRCGLVSFHDCGAMGGHCVESPTGAACVYPNAGRCTPQEQSCAGDVLTACLGGAPVSVDCVALGLKGCSNGHCVAP